MSEADWTTKTTWMRQAGVTDAAWSTEGHLVHAKLGALVPAEVADPADKPETAAQRAAREREERRRVQFAASGGPVARLNEGD